MKITIQFEAQLREAAGTAELLLEEFEAATLLQALNCAAAEHPALQERLFTGSEVSPGLLIFINEQPVAGSVGDQMLNDGDTVLLLPAISGG